MPTATFPFTLVTTSPAFPIIHLSGLSASPNLPLPWEYNPIDKNTISYLNYDYFLGMPFGSVSSLLNLTSNTPSSYRTLHGFKFRQNITSVYVTSTKEYYVLTNLALSGNAPGGAFPSGWSYSNPINALSASLDLEQGYILKVDEPQCGDGKYRGGSNSIIYEKDKKIGINTKNPTSTLTISGDATFTGSVSALSASFTTIYVNGSVVGGGAGNYLPLSGGCLTGPLSANESVEIYDIDSVKFFGEQKTVDTTASTITATNEFLKIEVNGKVRYIRLFELEKRPEIFSMLWDTTRLQGADVNDKTIVLPICSSSFAPSGIDIDWGDGIIETRTTPTLTGISHTYLNAGVYTVTVINNELL